MVTIVSCTVSLPWFRNNGKPKNRSPRTSSALLIKIHLIKVFPCSNSQELEWFLWLALQLYMKPKRSLTSRVCHVVSIPKCITLCNAVWDDLRYKVISTQMEVDFDTHLKSIQYKLKSFHRKSTLEEISHFTFASYMIAIDRKNVIPGQKEKNYVCLEVS